MRLVALGVLLSACGPVLVGEEEGLPRSGPGGAGRLAGAAESLPAGADTSLAPFSERTPGADGGLDGESVGTRPTVGVSLQALDCTCFVLRAQAAAGQAPYRYEWDDGGRGQRREICLDADGAALSVVAIDAAGQRSAPEEVGLAPATSCAERPPPAPTVARLCVENPSFEGLPAAVVSSDGLFAAAPWSACTNPERSNAPILGTPGVVVGVPAPVDGATFVALAKGQQVSQALCEDPPVMALMSFELDITRVTVGMPQPPEPVSLEVWAGLHEDCSQHELLWASPALDAQWERFCITLQPGSPMTQLTLRASGGTDWDYVFVDNLNPVDGCP